MGSCGRPCRKRKSVVHLLVKAYQKTIGSEKREQFQLLIFDDSITKNISPSAIVNFDETQDVNYSTGKSKVKDVYKQLRTFKKDLGDAIVKLIVFHV